MKKATRRPPKAPTQFEQIPVVKVKQIVGVTPERVKRPTDEKFIVPQAIKGGKRDL